MRCHETPPPTCECLLIQDSADLVFDPKQRVCQCPWIRMIHSLTFISSWNNLFTPFFSLLPILCSGSSVGERHIREQRVCGKGGRSAKQRIRMRMRQEVVPEETGIKRMLMDGWAQQVSKDDALLNQCCWTGGASVLLLPHSLPSAKLQENFSILSHFIPKPPNLPISPNINVKIFTTGQLQCCSANAHFWDSNPLTSPSDHPTTRSNVRLIVILYE